MSYLIIKALHVCAIVIWIAGMVILCSAPSLEKRVLERLRRWDRRVTTPAMLVAWITGLLLANQGDWFGNRWLTIKLVCAIALAALHGLLAGRLKRRIEEAASNSPPPSNLTLAGLFGLMAAIVLLVIVKPF